jgi:UDP-N-acetylmuramoylalanine--D-glutamate ligase
MSTLSQIVRERFHGRRVTVVGLGREGAALVRFLVPLGARVTVSDAQNEDALRQQLGAITGLPVRLALGGNNEADFLSADIVLLSPGVPLTLPQLAAAREHGVEVSSLTALFLEYCQVPVIGVTGSNGKTTTTSLIAAMLDAAGRPVWLGGNLGRPLIEQMEQMAPGSWAVIELSSFQLELVKRSPHISLVTNVSPNHLDMHPTFEAYIEAKRNIIRYQTPFDVAVLNQNNAVTRTCCDSRRAGNPIQPGSGSAWRWRLRARWTGRRAL